MLQFHREFAVSVHPNAKKEILKRAAAALRETEIRLRGAAWGDSFNILLSLLQQQTADAKFIDKLKEQRKTSKPF